MKLAFSLLSLIALTPQAHASGCETANFRKDIEAYIQDSQVKDHRLASEIRLLALPVNSEGKYTVLFSYSEEIGSNSLPKLDYLGQAIYNTTCERTEFTDVLVGIDPN